MPLDRTPRRTSGPVPHEPNIPHFAVVETTERRDRQVNMQVGAFLALPVVCIVLIFRPEASAEALGIYAAFLAATRQTWVYSRRQQHLRTA